MPKLAARSLNAHFGVKFQVHTVFLGRRQYPGFSHPSAPVPRVPRLKVIMYHVLTTASSSPRAEEPFRGGVLQGCLQQLSKNYWILQVVVPPVFCPLAGGCRCMHACNFHWCSGHTTPLETATRLVAYLDRYRSKWTTEARLLRLNCFPGATEGKSRPGLPSSIWGRVRLKLANTDPDALLLM
jgi:hypothetical protein